ncbi:MAG: hypothetical protein QOC80_2724 [Frankiaceae bacterium]|jgi:hypothetical protein|nr:hypothetical protein [Frankiaceae bacterium]
MTTPAWLPAPVQRARTVLRTRVSEMPVVYLPFARRKYPGPSPQVIRPGTRVVIDGYTRCATTFAVYAFQLSQPAPVPMAHHLHAPAQLITAARQGIPAIALIREPRGAVLSQLVREPHVDLRDALSAYARFYRRLLPYRSRLVVGEFRTVTRDFGAVIERVNERFGTDFMPFVPTAANVAAVNDLVRLRPTLSRSLLSFESGLVSQAELRATFVDGVPSDAGAWDESEAPGDTWLPSPERDARKAALSDRWESSATAAARRAAEDLYREFCS